MGLARTGLVGRDAELAVVREFVASLADGLSGLELTGEPGIGKTTLWSAAVDASRSAGATVLVAQPAESERELAFSGLNDLLGGLFDEYGRGLEDPRRRSLESALLRADHDARSDRLGVSLGVLDLLRAAAEGGPVVLAVDDLQWLDAPSASVLAFSMRRLDTETVSVLCASRPGKRVSLGLPTEKMIEIPLGPLSLDEVGRIVSRGRGCRLSRLTLLRVHALCGGNPLFALEVARALPATLADDVLPLPETLAELVRERLYSLGDETRDALLVVASLAHPSEHLVAAAVPDWHLRLAEASNADVLWTRDGRLGFTHPLLASCVYGDASPEERRRVHRLLVDIVDDADQVAWHLAHASVDPDESIAAELDSAAERVASRGAPAAAAELAAHARRLTEPADAEGSARRTLSSAGYLWSAGDGERSRSELEQLILRPAPRALRAQARQLLVKIIDDIPVTIAHLEHALSEAADDLALQASVHNLLSRQRMWASDFDLASADARAAADLARAAGSEAQLAVALARHALVEAFAGLPIRYDLLDAAMRIESSLRESLPVGESPTRIYGACALIDDDLGTAQRLTESAERQAASRSESWRAVILDTLAEIEVRHGDVERALAHSREAQEIGRYWGVGHAEAATLASGALVQAIAGNVADARRDAKSAIALMQPAGYDNIVQLAERALGFLEMSVGNPAAADAVLAPLLARAGFTPSAAAAAPDEIEALVELGRIEDAERLLHDFGAHVHATPRPRATAALARCKAVCAAGRQELEDAAEFAAHAVAASEVLDEPLETGRALLVQGIAYRRSKQKASARITLEQAAAQFQRTGAVVWLDRVHAELQRTNPRRAAYGELTPTEAQIARLAALGARNREIAEQMFVSVKTVEANLSRIYGKLDVRSRTELAARLARRDDGVQ